MEGSPLQLDVIFFQPKWAYIEVWFSTDFTDLQKWEFRRSKEFPWTFFEDTPCKSPRSFQITWGNRKTCLKPFGGGGWNLRNAYCMCPTVWSKSPSMELLVECHAGSLLFFPGLIIDKDMFLLAHILFRTRLQSYHQLFNWMNHHTSLILKRNQWSIIFHPSSKKDINESSKPVDGRNSAPVEVGSLSPLFTRVFYIPAGWEWDVFHQLYFTHLRWGCGARRHSCNKGQENEENTHPWQAGRWVWWIFLVSEMLGWYCWCLKSLTTTWDVWNPENNEWDKVSINWCMISSITRI